MPASPPGCRPRLGQAARHRDGGARGRQIARGEPQIDCEEREADRAERHEADLDLAARQALAQERADADADRERRQQQREHVLVAAEDRLGEHRQLREVDGAV